MREIYRDDYVRITPHHGYRVSVQVGINPEEERPAVTDVRDLWSSLGLHISEINQRPENVQAIEMDGGEHHLGINTLIEEHRKGKFAPVAIPPERCYL